MKLCKRGHEMAPENTYYSMIGGFRVARCTQCRRDQQKKDRLRAKLQAQREFEALKRLSE